MHAVSPDGARRGEFKLKKSDNKDWEDLASFRLDGEAYLMIADIGDNNARRKKRTLYFVREPLAEPDAKATTNWEVSYRYPDGPRDAESAAVDVAGGRALILSKRDIPPQLYAVPLQAESENTVVATPLGTITSLPRPTRQDVEFAPKTDDWHWQPVGMDISDDGLAAVILTYSAVYYYQRTADQDWVDAFRSRPLRIGIGNFQNAEAVAFADDARTVVVTGENRHALLISVDLQGVAAP